MTVRFTKRWALLLAFLAAAVGIAGADGSRSIRTRAEALRRLRKLTWLQDWDTVCPALQARVEPGDARRPPSFWRCVMSTPGNASPLFTLRLRSSDGRIEGDRVDLSRVRLFPRRPASELLPERLTSLESPRTALRVVGSDPRLQTFWDAHPKAKLRPTYAPDAGRWIIQVWEKGKRLGFVAVRRHAVTEIALPGFREARLRRLPNPQVLWRDRHAAKLRQIAGCLALIGALLFVLGDARRILSRRNLDAVIAGMLLTIGAWFLQSSVERTVVFVTMLLLVMARLVGVLFREPPRFTSPNLRGGVAVLLFALVALGNVFVCATRDLGDDSRCIAVCARYVMKTKAYPYGHPMSTSDVPGDRTCYGPVLYWLHVPGEALCPSSYLHLGFRRVIGYPNWEAFIDRETMISFSPEAVTLVFRFLGFAALIALGRRLGAPGAGLALATAYGLAPLNGGLVSSHIVPAVILLGCLLWRRRAVLSGALLALAAGTYYFPAFLAPTWVAWHARKPRSLLGFLLGFGGIGLLLGLSVLVLTKVPNVVEAGRTFYRSIAIQESASGYGASRVGIWHHLPETRRWLQPTVMAVYAAACFLPLLLRRKLTARRLATWMALLILGVHTWKSHTMGYYAWAYPLVLLALFWPGDESTALRGGTPERDPSARSPLGRRERP